MKDRERNLNPHKPARIAMILYSSAYGSQNGCSMDFWDSLGEENKKLCRELLKDIESSPIEVV